MIRAEDDEVFPYVGGVRLCRRGDRWDVQQRADLGAGPLQDWTIASDLSEAEARRVAHEQRLQAEVLEHVVGLGRGPR